VVGIIITPIADQMRLPFAGLAFASVVSFPGVLLFRMAGGMVDLVTLGPHSPPALLVFQVVADATTALSWRVFRLNPSENGHPIFHPVIVSSTAAKICGRTKSPFVAGKFGKGETL
jgi:hypothetical protein